MLHNMGFWHEHTRSDRDQFVSVDWSNILVLSKHNFWKVEDPNNNLPDCTYSSGQAQNTTFDHCDRGRIGETYGLAYDYQSIMHYGRNL